MKQSPRRGLETWYEMDGGWQIDIDADATVGMVKVEVV